MIILVFFRCCLKVLRCFKGPFLYGNCIVGFRLKVFQEVSLSLGVDSVQVERLFRDAFCKPLKPKTL